LDFTGDIATVQQQLAASHDLVVRRVAALEALGAAPGERILELGCGAGHCLREIGITVGPAGRALGIDLSEDQVRAAEARCADVAAVEVRVGNLLAVEEPDGQFDATLSIQVLEYVENVDAALTENARVTRPGGRLVNVATNWGSLFWTGGDDRLTRRVLEAWQAHAHHPNLPVALPSLLQAHGFDAVGQEPVTIMNRRFHPNTFSFGAARLMAAFAQSRGDLDADETEAWIESLVEADAQGRFFVSSVPVLTSAVLR
jgi:ubiquinone/menaquinone biosynthesis C-methylase UbiE